MMRDADIVAASSSSVYRVLSQAGALRRWEAKPSKKGKGFVPPPSAHAHWHIDVSCLNLSGTFYYLCSILDGYSSDNGPQFVAKDFKAFIRVKGMDHVRTSTYYPQSNGKLERWHKSLKSARVL